MRFCRRILRFDKALNNASSGILLFTIKTGLSHGRLIKHLIDVCRISSNKNGPYASVRTTQKCPESGQAVSRCSRPISPRLHHSFWPSCPAFRRTHQQKPPATQASVARFFSSAVFSNFNFRLQGTLSRVTTQQQFGRFQLNLARC